MGQYNENSNYFYLNVLMYYSFYDFMIILLR